MRKLLLLLLTVIVISCQQNNKASYVLLTGNIEDSSVKEVSVRGKTISENFSVTDGKFSDTIHITDNGFYTLRIGRNMSKIYLTKGDKLDFTLTGKAANKNPLSFTGVGANINNYLANKDVKKDSLVGDFYNFYSLEEDAYVTKVNEIEKELEVFLDQNNLSKKFTEIERTNIYFDKVSNLQMYEKLHRMVIKDNSFTVSENFPNEMENIDFTNESFLKNNPPFRMLMVEYYNKKLSEAFENNSDYLSSIKEAIQGLENGTLKDAVLMNYSIMALGPNEYLKDIYEFFLANSTNEEHKKSYTKNYDNYKHLAKGIPSPSFTYENYKGGTTSLNDLKGKYVYIDVWATWCAPCKKEIPYLKEIEKEFHDKNIAFVSISVDKRKDFETWRKMIEEKELTGIQLFADNDRNSKWYHDYKIAGIPRFILLDTEGNIISADAPRPSNPLLRRRLISLLSS